MKNLYAYLLLGLFTIVSFIACQKADYVIIKDDKGNVSEKYAINADSLKHGEYLAYINGAIVEKAQYLNGKLQGDRVIYHPNGQIEIEERYENNVIIGPYKTYYHTGTLAQEANYVKGMMQGILKTYYKDGSLKEEVTMMDNNENGPFTEYHQNGKVKWKGQFLNGDNEFGLLENYDDTGQLIKKMNCDSLGVCATIWTLEKGDIVPNK